MRVLQINKDYAGTGADRCARELYAQLPRTGVDTAMWVAARKSGEPETVRGIRSPWERVLMPLEALPDLTDWRHRGSIKSLREISPKTFDVVHLHILHSGWISIKAVHELCQRTPVVWTLHDEWGPNGGVTYNLTGKISPAEVKSLSRGLLRRIPYHRYHENFKWRRTRPFLKRWIPRPKAVLCPSRYIFDLAKNSGYFASDRLIHVPYGVRMPELPESMMPRDEARNKLGIPPARRVALMVAADLGTAHKGVPLGIAALRHGGIDHLHLLLMGGNASAIAAEFPEIKTTCMVAGDDETLAAAYRAADVTLVPSLGENFPYVALESLACQTPVVAFAVGGMPEIIGNDLRGMLANPADTQQMGRHVQQLLANDELRQHMGEAGRAWVMHQCNMDAYLRKIGEIYRQAIG